MPTYPTLEGQRALVTGATAGIGKATAEQLAQHGVDQLVITGRREDRLREQAKRWADAYGTDVVTAAFDVRKKGAIDRLEEAHPELFTVDLLVNNAGLARGTEPMHEARVEDWEEMIDTNVKGLLYMTRRVIPNMVNRGSGHVINLGSTAGRWVYPGGGVYCATKFAVRALTEGLRMDLLGTGVRVTNIAPGIVDTEFSQVRYKGDTEKAEQVYADTRALVSEDIADTILWAATRPDHVNIQELVVYPTDQAAPGQIHRRS